MTTALVRRLVILISLASLTAGAAQAQQQKSNRETGSVIAGMGFTTDPEDFLFALELLFPVSENISIGPNFQLGADDDYKFYGLSFNARYQARAGRIGDYDIHPFGEVGIGFARVSVDTRFFGRDIDDNAFLLDLAAGVEVPVTDRVSIGTRMDFDVHPDLFNDDLTWTWQILTARYRF